jgi:peptidoglycan/LPS O-acetylase OafA/YrhL
MAPSQTISESREVPWRDSRGRANNLDFLRFLFAVLVIYSHSYVLILDEDKGNYHEPFSVLTRGQTTGGGLAVAFFFIISGFLITQSWMNSRGLTDYLRRRVLRIYPGFIVVSLFCYLIVAPLGAAKPAAEVLAEFSLWRVLQYLVLLYLPSDPGVFVTNPLPYALNGSAWTIKYEFGCYVVVAFLGVAGLLRRRAWVLCLFAAWLTMFGLQISGMSAHGSRSRTVKLGFCSDLSPTMVHF